jgi:hypothetical protein
MQAVKVKVFISMLTSILTVCALSALGQSDNSIIGRIITDSTNVLPMLPVYALVEVSNNGTEPKEILFSDPVIVEYAASEDGPWQAYWPYGTPQVGFTPPQRRVMKPGESKSWLIVIHMNIYANKNEVALPVFTRISSNVFLRAHIGGHVTQPAEVKVSSPDGKDALALAQIEADPRILFILSACSDASACMIDITSSLYNQFIVEYGDTVYGAYARMGMAVIELSSDDPIRREAAIDELRNIGDKGPLSIRARAWLRAAQGVNARTKLQQVFLKHARDSANDDVVRYQIMNYQSVE